MGPMVDEPNELQSMLRFVLFRSALTENVQQLELQL